MLVSLVALTFQQKIEMSDMLLASVRDNLETVVVQYKITPEEDKVTRLCIEQRLHPLEALDRISSEIRRDISTLNSSPELVDRGVRKLEVARTKSFELRQQALMCRFGIAKGEITVKIIEAEMNMVDTPTVAPDVDTPEASPN